jgi:hypothetical protein
VASFFVGQDYVCRCDLLLCFFFSEKEIERKHVCALVWKVETFDGMEIFQPSDEFVCDLIVVVDSYFSSSICTMHSLPRQSSFRA